tara:strand:- start:33 stop:398 length:366 start_codon:yes stop_codon:yes gene_type:complete
MSEVQNIDFKACEKRLDLIEATCRQIQKDFQWFDEQIEFTGNADSAYMELFNQIKPIISRMINLDSERFFTLLYRIDIEEEKVKSILFGKQELAVDDEITHLIIRRELVKVVLRKHFSASL